MSADALTSPRAVVLQSTMLAAFPFVKHGITGRVTGLNRYEGNVAYSGQRDRDDAWASRVAFCAEIGVDPESLVTVGQVHGKDVIAVTANDAGKGARPASAHLGIADALITDAAGVALMTLHADCLMILLVDPERPAVGVVHAGWRGTVIDIAGATIARMTQEYGTDPAHVHAFLGPAISGTSNEVGPEVTAAWREIAADLDRALVESAVTRPRVKEHFDVPRANELLLLRAGLQPEHIERVDTCTVIDGDRWFSHRGQGPTTGRHGAIISLVQP
jgi:YfiH family protein